MKLTKRSRKNAEPEANDHHQKKQSHIHIIFEINIDECIMMMKNCQFHIMYVRFIMFFLFVFILAAQNRPI